MPKSIHKLPAGTQFMFQGELYTKIEHLNKITNRPFEGPQQYGLVNGIYFRHFEEHDKGLTEEIVTTTKEEYIQKYTAKDVPDGTKFRFQGATATVTKIEHVNDNYTSIPGYLDKNKAYKIYPESYGKLVWTLEPVTVIEKRWV